MKHIKQLIIVLISLVIAVSPVMTNCSFSYAADNDINWSDCETREEIVGAFKAYCNARNVSLYDGEHLSSSGIAGMLVTGTYDILDKLATGLGIDMTALQANCKYSYDNNGVLRILLTGSAINTFNRLFSALCNEYAINENEDENFDEIIKSGEWIQDSDGFGCFVYIIKDNAGLYTKFEDSNNSGIQAHGTMYKYDYNSISTLGGWTNNINGYQISYITYMSNASEYIPYFGENIYRHALEISVQRGFQNNGALSVHTEIQQSGYTSEFKYGHQAIFRKGTNYYLGNFQCLKINNTLGYIWCANTNINTSVNPLNAAISIGSDGLKTASHAFGQQAIIDTGKSGFPDYIEDNNTDVTVTDPTVPPYTDPYDSNNTGGNQDSNGNFNFQMPELNIDWNLDFGNNPPFPFSIPFDIINFMQAFNTEPVTPHIEETITIANMDIDIDIDLEWLDDVAAYFRKFILLSYIIGLIIATRALFHIY